MATKILAVPMDDKRKASVVETTILVGASTSVDSIDIRGFANFTVVFEVAVGKAVALHVSADNDPTTFVPLKSPGISATAVSLADGVFAYDVPELAGSHYVRFEAASNVTGGDTRTIKIMGKV